MKRYFALLGMAANLVLGAGQSPAQVPQIINYQGKVQAGTTNISGNCQFKFSLVNAAGTATYWSHDGTGAGGGQPTGLVTLPVANGLFSVALGDTSISGMQALPQTVFANPDVRLRVWFNDLVHGFQQLSPDRKINSVGYAMMAADVPAGSITSAKIAAGAVNGTHIAGGSIGASALQAGLPFSVVSLEYAKFVDEKPSGTDGGGYTYGEWNQRVLNKTVVSKGSSITRSGNIVTLQPGTYWIQAYAPTVSVSQVTAVRDMSGNVLMRGTHGNGGYYQTADSFINDILTVTGTALQVELATFPESLVGAGTNFGAPAAIPGLPEVYSTFMAFKLN